MVMQDLYDDFKDPKLWELWYIPLIVGYVDGLKGP